MNHPPSPERPSTSKPAHGTGRFLRAVRSRAGHRLVRSTGWMTSGFALTAASQATYFIIIARALGADGLGAFAAALAIVSILAPFVGWGAKNLLVMNTSRHRSLFAEYFGAGIVAVLLTGVVLAAGALAFGYIVFHGSQIAAVLPWVAAAELGAAPISDLVMHCYQGHERVRAASFVLTAGSGARVVAAILFVTLGTDLTAPHWAAWYLGASVLTAVVSLAFAMRQLGLPGLGRNALVTIFRHGVFYSIGSASRTVYADIDKTMLARMESASVAGVYTGGYRLVGMLSTPFLAFVYAANPRFFRDGESNALQVWHLAQRARKLAVIYGAIAGIGCLVLAPALPWILGDSFKQSSEVVRWLALLPLIQGIHLIYGDALMGVGQQPIKSAVQVATAGLNAGLNVWLIPLYSWRGAAVATLCGEGLLAFAMVLLLHRAAHPR